MNELAKAADESIMLDSGYLSGIDPDEGANCPQGNAVAQKILETGETP